MLAGEALGVAPFNFVCMIPKFHHAAKENPTVKMPITKKWSQSKHHSTAMLENLNCRFATKNVKHNDTW
jgi:hypothetical protein